WCVSFLPTSATSRFTTPSLHDALPILLARLRAVARRGPVERPVVFEVGDLRLDPTTRQVWRGSTEVDLSPKEFALLETFMRHPRSEEHTSELQSRFDLVCRLLLEKKKI